MTVDTDTMARIDELIDARHRLRAQTLPGRALSLAVKDELADLEAKLDACWAFLRQRRSRRYFHQDPDAPLRR